MSFVDALRHRIRTALRSERADRERAEEYAIHQSLAQEQRTNDGASSDDARLAARREFGNPTYLKEEARWMGVTRWLDVTRQDLGYAVRALRRSPVFTLVAIASLGLGIGANAAIFGMVHSLLLAKLPVDNPDALRLVIHSTDGPMRAFFASGEVRVLTADRRFDLAAFHGTVAANGEINGVHLSGLNIDAVDGAFFRIAGVHVSVGRPISASDVENAAQVAVLSSRSANARYGSARAALDKIVKLNDVLFAVIGVSDNGYEGLSLGGDYDMAVPMTTVPAMQHRPAGEPRPDLFLIARPGGDSSRLQSALDASFARCCANGALARRGSRQGIQRIGFLDISSGITEGRKIDVRRQYGSALLALMGGVAILLLIACTNVGNLLMARAAARAREMAVRLSLGASRGRIIRQLLAESLLLAVLGGGAGLVLAIWGSAALSRNVPPGLATLGPFVAMRPSLMIFGFTVTVTLACGLIFGVVPALRATRGDIVAGLRDHQTAGRRVRALDRGVVAIQVGLALLLLSCAGLLSATLRHLTESVGGSHPETLLVVQLDSRDTPHSDTLLQATVPTLHTRFLGVPGVKSVAESFVVPLIYGGLPTRLLDAPGFENASDDQVEVASFSVAPRYFETLGITLVAGRDFNDHDVVGSPRVAVISEHLARDFFPGRSPMGQSIGFRGADGAGRDLTIVGVVADAKQSDLRSPAPNTVYLTRRQWPDLSDRAVFAIRTSVPAAQLVTPARAIILGELPRIRIRHLLPMTDLLSMTVGRESALAYLAVAFGFVALFLAAIGLYGVMAFQVSARTREIGVRMALGARRSQVVRMVIGQALLVVAVGVGVGIPFALVGARSLRALLYGITPFDPAPLASGAVVLVIVGALAALIPSRRAARVDPLVALRCE
jgi:putative ABC transport system permease protein